MLLYVLIVTAKYKSAVGIPLGQLWPGESNELISWNLEWAPVAGVVAIGVYFDVGFSSIK